MASDFKVLKNDSAMALSQQSPLRLMLRRIRCCAHSFWSDLNSAIGMQNQALMNASAVQCHSERGNGGFVCFHGATERPPHDFTSPQIHDNGQIHPAVPDSDVGQIADPDLIRSCGIEVAFDVIPSN